MDKAGQTVAELMTALKGRIVPLPLFCQHMPGAAELFADRPLDPEELLIWRITESLTAYQTACNFKDREVTTNGT